MKNRNWTREDRILAFNLYCQIPFGQMHARNPRVVELPRLLERGAVAVAKKLCNFARPTPALHARDVKGLALGGKGLLSLQSQ